jgi:transposase
MNWNDNLTMVGALRADKWLTLATHWGAMNRERFIPWVRRHLVRHLQWRRRRGDGQSAGPQGPAGARADASAGATLRFLPPYSHDFNPTEAWGLIKKRIRVVAPRTAATLRQTAQRARRVVRPRHCKNWFGHAGYELK